VNGEEFDECRHDEENDGGQPAINPFDEHDNSFVTTIRPALASSLRRAG
jgi:hypothetical protein